MEICDVWSLEVMIGLNALFEICFSASAGFITDAEAGELIISSDLQNVMEYFCGLDRLMAHTNKAAASAVHSLHRCLNKYNKERTRSGMGGYRCFTFEPTAEVVTDVTKRSVDKRENKVVQYCHVISLVII